MTTIDVAKESSLQSLNKDLLLMAYLIGGKDSYVYNNESTRLMLYGYLSVVMNDKSINGDVLDYYISQQSGVGSAFGNCYGIDQTIDFWNIFSTMKAVLANSTAVSAILANPIAISAISTSELALSAVFNDSMILDQFMANDNAIDAFVTSELAMNMVASNETAATKIVSTLDNLKKVRANEAAYIALLTNDVSRSIIKNSTKKIYENNVGFTAYTYLDDEVLRVKCACRIVGLDSVQYYNKARIFEDDYALGLIVADDDALKLLLDSSNIAEYVRNNVDIIVRLYEQAALSIDGIYGATAVSSDTYTSDGTMTLYITPETGLPSSSQLTNVKTFLTTSAIGYLCYSLTVAEPACTYTALVLKLYVSDGYDFDTVSAVVKSNISAFFTGARLSKGLNLNDIYAIINSVEGVSSSTITYPTASIDASDGTIILLSRTNITSGDAENSSSTS